MAIGAFFDCATASLEIFFSSLIDSTLNIKISFSNAYLISLEFLPTPEKTILFGAISAFRARFISPIDTTSAPDPIFAKFLIIDWLEFDFTA